MTTSESFGKAKRKKVSDFTLECIRVHMKLVAQQRYVVIV